MDGVRSKKTRQGWLCNRSAYLWIQRYDFRQRNTAGSQTSHLRP